MALSLVKIAGRTGTTQNVGGLTQRIRVSIIGEITTLPAKKEISDGTVATADELVDITDDRVYAATKGSHEWYITRDTGKVDFKINEARDTTGSVVTFEGITPGNDSVTEGNLLFAANNFIIADIETAPGEWVQIGSARFPAELKYEWSSEHNESGECGWKIKISGFETSKQKYLGAHTVSAS